MRTPPASIVFIVFIFLSQECLANTKVYVGNLAWNTINATLRAAFQPYGQILDATVSRDPDTKRSLGFGYVTFSTKEEAEAAIAAMNDQELDGKRIRVKLAKSSK